jgi:ankyrin repeat protein
LVIAKQKNNKTNNINNNELQNAEVGVGDMNSLTDELINAVVADNVKLAEKIINDGGININKKDSSGKYPIEKVIDKKDCDMAKVLLKAGADPYVLTSNGISVYDKVMKSSNDDLKKTFLEYSKKNSVMTGDKSNSNLTIDELTNAVLVNNIELVNKIINSEKININEKDSNGEYPIEKVIVMGNCDMAKILLEAGADPYVLTSDDISVYDEVMKGSNKYLKTIFKAYKR